MLKQLRYWWTHKAVTPLRVVFGCCLLELAVGIVLLSFTFFWGSFRADLGSSEYIEKKDYGSLYAFHRTVSGMSGGVIFLFNLLLLYLVLALQRRTRFLPLFLATLAVACVAATVSVLVAAYLLRATEECNNSVLCKPGDATNCVSEAAKEGKPVVASVELCEGLMRLVEVEFGLLVLSAAVHITIVVVGVSVKKRWEEITSHDYTRTAEMFSSSFTSHSSSSSRSHTVMASPDDLWGSEE